MGDAPQALREGLKSDTLWYGTAVLFERLLGLLLLPVLTRRLSSEDYGVWAQTAVVSSVLMPLVLFGLPAAIVKFFSAGVTPSQRRRWMGRSLRLLVALFGLLGLLIGALPGAASAAAEAVYGSAAQRRFIAVLLTVLAADALFDLLVAYLRSAFRMRWIAGLLMARGSLRLGFMLLALGPLGWSFGRAFGMLALLQLGVVAAVFGLELRRLGSAPTSMQDTDFGWRALLAFAAPLVLVAVLTSINGFADRFVLTHLLGLGSVAVYAAVASVVAVTSVAYTVLGFTLFPVLARLWAEGDTQRAAQLAAEAVRAFLFIALPFTLWLASVADTLLPLLTTQAYRVPGEVVLMLGFAAIGFGLYQIVLYLLLLAGKGLHAAWLMGLAAALNTALNLLLVPRFGLAGAAGAAAASNALLAGLAGLAAHRHAQARFPWAGALHIALGTALALGALGLASPWLPRDSWTGLLLGLVGAGAIYLAADLAPGHSVLRMLAGRQAERGTPA